MRSPDNKATLRGAQKPNRTRDEQGEKNDVNRRPARATAHELSRVRPSWRWTNQRFGSHQAATFRPCQTKCSAGFEISSQACEGFAGSTRCSPGKSSPENSAAINEMVCVSRPVQIALAVSPTMQQ